MPSLKDLGTLLVKAGRSPFSLLNWQVVNVIN